MKRTPFSEINRYVQEKLGNGELCTGELFCYIKVMQHGLSYYLNEDRRKLIRTYFSFPIFIHFAIMFLRALLSAPAKIPSLRKALVIDAGRKVGSHSFFFGRVIESIGRENVTVINTGINPDPEADIDLSSIATAGCRPGKEEMLLLRDIRKVLARCKGSGKFTTVEMDYIQSSFHVFFEEFRRYNKLLKQGNPRACIFITHYHKEGLIAALKRAGVQSMELQHGLVARNDLYYIYPAQFSGVIKKGLFPDRIFVFGEYWKELLLQGCEWDPSRIVIAGNLQWTAGELPTGEPIAKENLLLVAAQKNSTGAFIAYVRHLTSLLPSHPGWSIVVKMHPLEKEVEQYLRLQQPHVRVVGNEQSIHEWIQRARIQVSFYSTTFYDALGKNVVNFSLQNDQYEDYAREMVMDGIALPLAMDGDPFAIWETLDDKKGQLLPRERVYSPGVPERVAESI